MYFLKNKLKRDDDDKDDGEREKIEMLFIIFLKSSIYQLKKIIIYRRDVSQYMQLTISYQSISIYMLL